MSAQASAVSQQLLGGVTDWYEAQRRESGGVNTNVMCVGLAMVEHMSATYPLDRADYATDSQVRNIGGPAIARILARHGEHRSFTAEGGRTSRGSLPLADQLATVLNTHPARSGYLGLSEQDKAAVCEALQRWFVERVRDDFFDRQRLAADIDAALASHRAIASILAAARERGCNAAGAVAQHLVGATLQLRFPDLLINSESYTTADLQTERPGDFLVGDTAIHVTLSPSDTLLSRRCRANVANGYRPLVLVPDSKTAAASQLAEVANLADRVRVESIEGFVSGSLEEAAGFTTDGIRKGLRLLLETYNDRVRSVERDPSLQIEIPENL